MSSSFGSRSRLRTESLRSKRRTTHHRPSVARRFLWGDSIFAFVRWVGNDYGPPLSRIDILRAVGPGERRITVPYVRPGRESLLQISGWPKVEKVLQAIDAIEALGIDPADAAAEHWQHVHNRVSVGERPRSYTRTRHQAWLHRRKLIS